MSSLSAMLPPPKCARGQTLTLTGRRRAKRDGNPTASEATLLGAPVQRVVGRCFALHLTTSSARIRIDAGIVSPKALAALRLTIS